MKYKLIQKIGSGSYGHVAKVSCGNQLFALKTIYMRDTPEQNMSILTELLIILHNKCKHVVQLYGLFADETKISFLITYCQDRDVKHLIQNSNMLPDHQIWKILIETCYALHYLHQNNIIHRDLKPSNILLHKGSVKLCDFGVSCRINSEIGHAYSVVGTPYYLSPELITNKPYNSKVDIWSLGCVLYELIFLKPAFDYIGLGAIVNNIHDGTYIPRYSDTHSDGIQSLISLLITIDPNERPSVDKLLRESPAREKRYLTHRYELGLRDSHFPAFPTKAPATCQEWYQTFSDAKSKRSKITINTFQFSEFQKLPPL